MPRLSVDRSFTYVLAEGERAGTGSLVSVPFHGRTVRGWILGPANDAPAGRLLPVGRVRSAVRFFDPKMLALLRWVSERYIAPLCTVIARSHPPRVAGLERERAPMIEPKASDGDRGPRPGSSVYPAGVTAWLRPLPGREADECVAAVTACIASGRQALVLVPEAEPVPNSASAVLEACGPRAVAFLGGDHHTRYRTWLQILGGRYDVVIGTRPAVFAPLSSLGLVWISREVHPGHREERSPYYHVREVASARARLEEATCVLASLSPSVETAAGAATGSVRVFRPPRAVERASAPLVETAVPEGEDRSTRLSRLLRNASSASLIVSRRGYGVARVCRSCGEPAACDKCRGVIVSRSGESVCGVCGAPGRCAACGGVAFGVERGGTERVAEWARGVARGPVREVEEGSARPDDEGVAVGTAAGVKEVGSGTVELVAILDPDRALSRPGIHAGERAVATWMEAAAWAGPRGGGGRVLVQTRHPGHPAVQALVRWDPLPFLEGEARRRMEGGFPPGHPVFRLEGPGGLEEAVRRAGGKPLVAAPAGEGRVCLLTIHPAFLGEFRTRVLRLASEGSVTRVEAEPQL